MGYGSDNQNTYLMQGLASLYPELWRKDWFVQDTFHYHDNFSLIVQLLGQAGDISWNMAVANILVVALTIFAVSQLLRALTPKHFVLPSLILFLLITIDQTVSVAFSALQYNILQPSSLGAMFTVVALLLFVQGRYLLSGVALGLGGYYHSNFLLIGFVYFGLAHLLLGRNKFVLRVVKQFGLSLIVLALVLPFLLSMASSEHSKEAAEVFLKLRSPHHYVPMTYLDEFIPFIGWQLLAVLMLFHMTIDSNAAKRLCAYYFASLTVILIATFLTTVVFITFISQLYFWRLAPLTQILAQIIFIAGASKLWYLSPNETKRVSHLSVLVFLIGAGMVIYGRLATAELADPATIILIATLCIILLSLFSSPIRILSIQVTNKILCAIILVAILFLGYISFYRQSTVFNGFPGAFENSLVRWAKKTPVESVFLVSPDMLNFRLHSERSIVVDWKSAPIDHEGLRSWYTRMVDLSSQDPLVNSRLTLEGFHSISVEKLFMLREKYPFDYIVFRKRLRKEPMQLPKVFENKRFIVYRLPMSNEK